MRSSTLFTYMADKITNDRPIPWVGMPVYLRLVKKGAWCILDWCSKSSSYFLVGYDVSGIPCNVDAYATDNGERVVLPSEPGCPEMPDDVVKEVLKCEPFKDTLSIKDGRWRKGHSSSPFEKLTINIYNQVLLVPASINIEDVFNYGPSQKPKKALDLKALNQDGRQSCAACGSGLKEPYPGIRYCPACES